jgi:uncharacterized protein YlxW (UPF0749 family)
VIEGTSPSLGVLEEFMSSALADDYVHAARDGSASQSRGRAFSGLAVLMMVAIGVLTAAVLFSTVSTAEQRSRTRSALADRVDRSASDVAQRQVAVSIRRGQISELEQQLLTAGDADLGVTAQAGVLAAAAGTTPIAGSGLTVTVDDAPDAQAGSMNRVLDRDLQDIVNALWSEGATGIAINGHRLTSATAIRSAGEAIVVNYEPLARPYRIAVAGAPSASDPASGARQLLSRLERDYGLVTEVSLGDVALPAGDLREPIYAVPQPTPNPGGNS